MKLFSFIIAVGTTTSLALAQGGGGGFDPAVSYSTPTNPAGIAAGDFDGDGDIDLAIATQGPDKVSILFNNSLGAFVGPFDILLPPGSSPGSIVAADLDGDFDIDLAVALRIENEVHILINNGGSFEHGPVIVAGGNPQDLIATNLDGDGDMDMVMVNQTTNTITVVTNLGPSGFFTTTYATGLDPSSVAAGDANGDGVPELFVTNRGDRSISVFMNNGAGSFSHAPDLPVNEQQPSDILAANLDGDSDIDLAVTFDAGGVGNIAVYLNNGGQFSSPTVFAVDGMNPISITAADVDKDGDRDVITVNEGSSSFSILTNSGAGAFNVFPPVTVATGLRPDSVIAAPLNIGSRIDLAITSRDSSTTNVYLNSGATSCYANCDNSVVAPVLTANDFQCFIDRYAAQDPYANCDGSNVAPVLTANDFQCFIDRYAAGCP